MNIAKEVIEHFSKKEHRFSVPTEWNIKKF